MKFLKLALTAPLLLPLAANAQTACVAPSGALNNWHWYSAEQLQEVSSCSPKTGCDGRYVAPARTWPGAELAPDKAPVHGSADRTRMEGSKVELYGDVIIHKGQLSLQAGNASFDRDSEEFLLDDSVAIILPEMMLTGERAKINGADGTGLIERARFVAFKSGVRAKAKRIKRPTPQELELRDAFYTQCPPDSEAWMLEADNIHLDYATGRGVSRGTVLKVKGVPVFYSPWLDFPVDDRRATGLLWPGFASSDGGLDVSIPYYFNLAPNYDLTLTPRFLEERGDMLEAEGRYLNRWSEWQLSTAYLKDDKQAEIDRWLIGISEFGSLNEHWSTAIAFNRISDVEYFEDLSVASLNVRRATYLDQSAQVNYQSERWRSKLIVQQYQELAGLADTYRKMPEWSLEYLPVVRNLRPQPIFLANVTAFDHEDNLEDGGLFITGVRSYLEAGVRLPYIGRAGHIIGTFKSRHLSYQLDDGVVDTSPEVTAAMASLDAALVFERDAGSFRQTLEPRLFYLYNGYEAGQEAQPLFDTSLRTFDYHQLFRDSRFTGYDRLDDVRQLAVGLSSSFYDKNTGRERLTLGIGQAFYFEDRQVTLPETVVAGTATTDPTLLKSSIIIPGTTSYRHPGNATATAGGSAARRKENSSDVATHAQWQANDRHWFSADAVFDRDDARVNQAHLGWHYRGNAQTLYNFGYTQRRMTIVNADDQPELKQLDASASLPLGRQWHLFARWQYDLQMDRTLEGLFGIAYESCCWTVRTLYQRALEPDHTALSNDLENDRAILLEFQLKGLGGLGDKLTGVLEESIFGYRDE